MDALSLNKEKINNCSPCNEINCEQSVEADITLPEYYPAIVSILRCSVSPVLESVSVVAERITADGEAVIKLLYCSEDGRLCSFDTKTRFSKAVDAPGLSDGTVFSSVTAERFNCRALSNRKIDIRGEVSITHSVCSLKTAEIVTAAEGAGVQLKTDECEFFNFTGLAIKRFAVSEDINLSETEAPVDCVLSSGCTVRISEVKAADGKALIKGELCVGMLYRAGDDTGELENHRSVLPFSEIIEVAGLSESDICCAKAEVKAHEINIKPGASEVRSVNVYARLTVEIRCGNTVKSAVCNDCFSTQYETESVFCDAEAVLKTEKIEENHICRGNISLPDAEAVDILDVRCVKKQHSSICRDGKMLIRGSAEVDVLIKNGQGSYQSKTGSLDYEYALNCPEKTENMLISPDVAVIAATAAQNGNMLEVKAELLISGTAIFTRTERVTADIKADENMAKSADGGLVIYFTAEGDSVWDISRKYNISPAVLKNDNTLADDVLDAGRMLLISCGAD